MFRVPGSGGVGLIAGIACLAHFSRLPDSESSHPYARSFYRQKAKLPQSETLIAKFTTFNQTRDFLHTPKSRLPAHAKVSTQASKSGVV